VEDCDRYLVDPDQSHKNMTPCSGWSSTTSYGILPSISVEHTLALQRPLQSLNSVGDYAGQPWTENSLPTASPATTGAAADSMINYSQGLDHHVPVASYAIEDQGPVFGSQIGPDVLSCSTSNSFLYPNTHMRPCSACVVSLQQAYSQPSYVEPQYAPGRAAVSSLQMLNNTSSNSSTAMSRNQSHQSSISDSSVWSYISMVSGQRQDLRSYSLTTN
jgi:hypothetical protein